MLIFAMLCRLALASAALLAIGLSVALLGGATMPASGGSPPGSGDANCDGVTNAIDATLVLQKSAGLLGELACEAKADANLDGAINSLDSALILQLAAGLIDSLPVGRPTATPTPRPGPTPTGTPPEPASVDTPDPGIDYDIVATSVCVRGASHEVEMSWNVHDAAGTVRVRVTLLLPDGETLEGTGGPAGDAAFALDLPEGGHVVVLLSAEAGNGSTAQTTVVALPPCEDPPPTPPPGVGFVPEPASPPPLGEPGGTARDVDIAHLGGSPDGPTQSMIVAAVGSGGSAKLTSWTIDAGSMEPVFLQETDPFPGADVKLHALSPATSPDLTVALVVCGYRRDGNLWLTTWKAAANGTLTKLDTLGFGANAGVVVASFDIAHHPTNNGNIQVVTPVRTDGNMVRLVTWSVNPNTGAIAGLHDSGDTNQAESGAEISTAYIDDDQDVDYVVTFPNTNGDLRSQLWEVFATGDPFLRGSGASGLSLRGGSAVTEPAYQNVALPLTKAGFLTGTVDGAGAIRMVAWDYRRPGFEVYLLPYRVAGDDGDLMLGPGVNVGPPPVLTDSSKSYIEDGALQQARAILTDVLWEESFGVGDGAVYSELPFGESMFVGIASVTKVMTLLVAVEAIEDGDVDLDDDVTTSEAAADVSGSSMDLIEGETQSLQGMMHGMMLVSGNDASVAIAEHVGGTEETFVAMMNAKADDLGMSNTLYNQPAGGGYSTPQDLVTLWLEGWEHPLFRQLTTTKEYNACGTGPNQQPLCRYLVKFADNGYPGLEGWKNGDWGFPYEPYADDGVPMCTHCLLAQATRLDRSFAVAIQQSDDRWGDTANLFDYGFTKLFTPDLRGSSGAQGAAGDFALDKVTDTLAVTAVIDAEDHLKVCSWQVVVDLGQIGGLGCEVQRVLDLAQGGEVIRPTRVDGALLSTLLVEGDYLTGRTLGGQLVLNVWRVAPKEP